MNPIEFARNLFALRMERGMTVEELAEALNTSPETVCEWECAKTSPSLDQMNRLARLYGISLDEVIRNPKPHDTIPVPPVPQTAEEPKAEEPKPTPVSKETVAKEASPAPARRRKRKTAFWEILVILLLLALMGAALVFAIRPDLFPFLPN